MDSSDEAWETARTRSGRRGVMEEAGGGEEKNVFVALPEHHRNGRSTLAWALRHIADMAPAAGGGDVVVVVAHVHAPAQMIPMMGSKFHASKLRPEQVRAYRKYERKMVNKHLDEYIHQCSKMKVKGKKLVVQNEDVAKGITELVSLHNVSQLVMGAASDKHYSRKMEVLKSKKALAVMHDADTSCKIWFVCKDHLICTREAGVIRSSASTLPECSAPPNQYARFVSDGCIRRSVSEKLHIVGRASLLQLPCLSTLGRTLSKLSLDEVSVDSWDSTTRESFPSSYRDEVSIDFSSFEVPRDSASATLADRHFTNKAPCHEQGDKDSNVGLLSIEKKGGLFEKLEEDSVDALKDAEELHKEKEDTFATLNVAWNTEFCLLELKQATRNFSDTMKIGEGGYGCVYKGVLRNATVAIKMLRSQNTQGQSQFHQEVAVLSRVKHPNLVTLMGSCPEASGLVYEFLPNGSLEDRLACENSTPPLTWQTRTRIIGEVCSALVFLHSNTPSPVIHGDLKPANILLDANLVSKLGDFGVSCLLTCRTTSSSSALSSTATSPRGTFAYMDPEFLTTGELTPRSDVYSFGIVVLRLVTGMPPLGIARQVEDALEKGEMELLVDPSAGEWPFPQAEKLMLLGLQCAELSRRRRPDRMSSVWRVVEPLVKAASLAIAAKESFEHQFCENHMPSYFICPISQEVMRNPHIAADGFTYEAEAIRGWLDSGHDTSPMTKLALAHRHVTPNYALGSAIEDYMKQQQQQHVTPSSQPVRSV